MDSGKTQEVNEEERIDDRRTMAITFRGSEVGLRRLSEWIEQAAPDCNVKIIYTKIRDGPLMIVPGHVKYRDEYRDDYRSENAIQ